MKHITTDILIIGCGWTGLLASYFILKKNPNINLLCVDKEEKLGGLMRTENINNFTFDIGGSHIIFSKNQEILREMLSFLGNNSIRHYRKTFIYLEGTYVPYPFENGIWILPPEKRSEILVSFVEMLIERTKNPNWSPYNLEEWIYGFFGKEIAKLYLVPYNKKIWKRDLKDIDIDWVYSPGRIPIPDWKDNIRSGAGVPTEGYKEQMIFYYPLRGGIQALYNSVLMKAKAKGLKIIKNLRIDKIKKTRDGWIVNNFIKTNKLITTIPLNEFVHIAEAPEYIIKLSRQLDYNSVAVIGLALRKKAPKMHWIYVPDKNIIFHRYAWLSNYSPFNTPDNDKFSSIIAEVTIPSNKKSNKNYMLNRVIEDAKRLKIISEKNEELYFSTIWFSKYGYPVHTKKTTIARKKILEFLDELGVICLGRWGTWRYLNMDKIYMEIRHNTFLDK